MKKMDLINQYFESVLGPVDKRRTRQLSPMEFIEALWPLNDIFKPHIEQIATVRYRPRFEAQANEAIERFVAIPKMETWANLSPGVWRVLLERHRQMIDTAVANDGAGNINFAPIPDSLPDDCLLPALMLLWLHSMELPFPVKDRTAGEFPDGDPPASMRRH